MKTEDKFLLSSGLSFLFFIIFEIIDFFVDTDKYDYNTVVKWLNISLYITIFVCIWFIISIIGFFVSYKIEHGKFPKSDDPGEKLIPSNLFCIAAILCLLLPPIGLCMFIYLFVYYKMR